MFVFFFKQKTAYEMRISDWSSDVCSSDLVDAYAAVDPRRACIPGRLPGIGFPLGCDPVSFGPVATPVVQVEPARLQFALLVPNHGKIGRASCRERVCQYV